MANKRFVPNRPRPHERQWFMLYSGRLNLSETVRPPFLKLENTQAAFHFLRQPNSPS